MQLKRLTIIALIFLLCGCSTVARNNLAQTKLIDPTLYSDPIGDTAYEPVNFSDNAKNYNEEVEPETPQPVLDQALDFYKASQEFWQQGELENALQSLDQAYSLIVNLDISDSTKQMQQKEDLRFMISKRILEIYASRNITVSGTHNAIPVIINKQVQREIDIFTKKDRRFFIQAVKKSGRYRPMILAELKKEGLPPELSWLPLVESGFKVDALSKARALGLWQFIPSTGYMFGLKRDLFVDERLNPEKSTRAAIAYMKKMHKLFGDWATVLAAYNCGEGRVLRIIRSQKVNYLDNFWDLYGRLPRETARYVPRFIATLHIINNMEKYGFDAITRNEPLQYETVTVSKQVRLRDIAKALHLPEKELRNLNPELRYKILPGTAYPLNLPIGKKAPLLASIDKIRTALPPQKAFVYHRVKLGETLSTIAEKYKTSTRTIARANKISKKNFIVAGKILKIPQNGTAISYARKTPRNYSKKKLSSRHVVKSGDSLWIIARRYGTTTRKIKTANNLSGSSLRVGQVLKIPGLEKNAKPSKGTAIYHVKRGDSPFTIAMRHNMSVSKLLALNKLTAGSKIYPGQKLYIE